MFCDKWKQLWFNEKQDRRHSDYLCSLIIYVCFQTEIVQKHLELIDPKEFSDVAGINPWRSTLWELVNECSVRGRFNKHYSHLCSGDETVSEEVWDQISSEVHALLVMKAVAATARALSGFIFDECKISEAVCEKVYSRRSEVLKRKYDLIVNVKFANELENLRTGEPKSRPFLENGDGNMGFTISSLEGKEYKKIATVTPGYEKINADPFPSFPLEGVTRRTFSSTSDRCLQVAKSDVGYIAGFTTGVIVLVVVVAVVVMWWRRRRSQQKDGESCRLN